MTKYIALIDYGSGNLRSAEKALARAALERCTDCEIRVTNDPDFVLEADRIVLPGVGAFADCMSGLLAIPRLADAISEAVLVRGRPFLGICVGMQLMASVGREFGDSPGLGWIAGEVVRIAPRNSDLKVPHMGWNELRIARGHPILQGIANGAHVYFVHSFEFRPGDASNILATADYGGAFAAVVGRANLIGTQFHPEKSQKVGLRILSNFLEWRP